MRRICAWLVLVAACHGGNVRLGDLTGDAAFDAASPIDVERGEDAVADATVDAMSPDVVVDAMLDAATEDAPAPDAATACDCGPESCGTRACGRSACGYPCGTCRFDEWCAGGSCYEGSGPGSRCSDAFDWYGFGNVWEGDQGFRVCPGDPTKVEACTCGGGGADAWISCSGSCFAPCVGSVECGSATCGPLEYCQGCSGSASTTYTCRPRDGSNGSCPSTGMVFDAFCDGNDDCAPSDRCMAVVGDIVSMRCERDDVVAGCGIGAASYELCSGPSDCSTCSSCSPSTFADWTTPGFDLGVCR